MIWQASRRFGGVFEVSDLLFRDSFGQRVLIDADGELYCPPQRDLDFEGLPDYLRVTAPLGWKGEVYAWTGGAPPLCDKANTVTEVEGPGWWVEGSVMTLDQPHQVQMATPQAPIPFHLGAQGQGRAIAIPDAKLQCLQDWSPTDPDAARAPGWQVRNASRVMELASSFADGTELTAPLLSHLNTASWQVDVPAGTRGIVLRKRFDQFHGRQRARVLLNDEFWGWWCEPAEDRHHRWAWGFVALPWPPELAGLVTIAMDPPAGTPLWSVSQLTVHAVM